MTWTNHIQQHLRCPLNQKICNATLFAEGVYGVVRSKSYVLLIFKSAICICLFHHIHWLSLHVQIWGRWIYNLCNQCVSQITFWVQIPIRRCVLDITLCDKVYQLLARFRWVLRIPPPIKVTPRYNCNSVESGVKHHSPNTNSVQIWKTYQTDWQISYEGYHFTDVGNTCMTASFH